LSILSSTPSDYILMKLLFSLTLIVSLLFVKTDLYTQHALQIETDSLFNSPQVICIFSIAKKDTSTFFHLAHHPSQLKKTSQFANENKATVAINGGFFDTEKGGSVTYLEAADSVFHFSKNIRNKVINQGAVIIDQKGKLHIEVALTQYYYQQSKAEQAVLFMGPILLNNGLKARLDPSGLISNRHPRTCICETQDHIKFITIDGRQINAAGMNLWELQNYLLSQNCLTAINLDGGGSTTMWVKEKGIVNRPSDFFGERPVANALLLLAKP